jgi:putative phosphoribosyl transferase
MQQAPVLIGSAQLSGVLTVPAQARGLVLFAHGSGSSRHSPRNQQVAAVLQTHGLATLLFDLLNAQEGQDRRNVFNITLLARRLAEAVDWAGHQQALARLPLGLFGASTGAAAALVASALRPGRVQALVCRGGRPDLAASALPAVTAPTLMIVGGADLDVLDLNQQAIARMRAPVRLKIIPGASHLFEEPGALNRVALLAAQWFRDHAPAQAGTQAGTYAGAGRQAAAAATAPIERRQRAERRRWPRPAVSALSSSIAAGITGAPGGANGSLARPSIAGQAPGLKAFRPGR